MKEFTVGMNDMKNVKFYPWVGEKYYTENMKMLILGESHHSKDKPSKSFTIDLVKGISRNDWTHAYWTNIMQAVDGREKWEIDKNEFWEKHIFYNYIQEIVGEGPRIAPSDKMWKDAWIPFCEVLNEYKPTHVLVVGKRLWDSLPNIGRAGVKIEVEGAKYDTWHFPYDKGEAISTYMNHPSSGFSAKKWHMIVSRFLEMK